MTDTDKMTLQEAAIAAGFDDFMLEPGGGIRVWGYCGAGSAVLPESEVRELAEKRLAK
jgi:hypothetical protein